MKLEVACIPRLWDFGADGAISFLWVRDNRESVNAFNEADLALGVFFTPLSTMEHCHVSYPSLDERKGGKYHDRILLRIPCQPGRSIRTRCAGGKPRIRPPWP
ncbi:Hypothetical protein NTJ_07943 [Nesidiocoris tenuis]|uniref:Uncharacterized protein n=1 Tax=Nesidiocoris tenuis TaxID=355587 RepID=A0ABN7AUE1_9HEMI|nr:Hypothetical protein NTJ_07943 [Nesidiocoris tenuis]